MGGSYRSDYLAYNAFMQGTRITLKTLPLVDAESRRLIEGIASLRQRIGRGDMEALEQLA